MKKFLISALAVVTLISVFTPSASAYNSNFAFYSLARGKPQNTGYVTKDDNEQNAYVSAYSTTGWAHGKEFASFFVRDTNNNSKTELLRIMYPGNYSTKYSSRGYANKKYKLHAFYEHENPYNYMNITGKWCP